MISNYYKFASIEGKSQSRKELVSFNSIYEPLHKPQKKSGAIVLYIMETKYMRNIKSTAKYCLTINQDYLSEIKPDENLKNPNFFYGDFKNSNDMFLLIIKKSYLEIFILKDYKHKAELIYKNFTDLDENLFYEIDEIRKKALPFEPVKADDNKNNIHLKTA